MRKSRIAAACAAVGLLSVVSCIETARRKPPPELAVEGPVLTPIRHEKFFRGERELFGYDPAMLLSDDSGEAWRLAVTKDFVAGLR